MSLMFPQPVTRYLAADVVMNNEGCTCTQSAALEVLV